ncbi:hypothetical protein BVG16_20265 [Paenibacillus selenitireducens]|uniref:Uncharacterized protein n=1 Tax=Paenibacillus selenitireducens TaxID=1324314 RepID=A0A1T2X715_9BACL|nr:hypothetical protein [Paenibacillus selenitireducens]OPA75669.1 hypothetical protein BVG16_20265 [Paenibacillus selenitireducens]
MLLTLLWIVLSYALAVAAVHLAFRWRKKHTSGTTNREVEYVLVTKQNQSQIEWVVRALMMYAWLQGKTLRLTIIDEDSTDLTIPIAQRLTMDQYIDVKIVNHTEWKPNTDRLALEAPIPIRLNDPDDWAKLPFVH